MSRKGEGFHERTPGTAAWASYKLVPAALELVPGIAIAVVWLGSRPESVKYTELSGLHLVALLPSVGWLLRLPVGCAVAPALWCARIVLIIVALSMWGRANDHYPLSILESGGYREHCCEAVYGTAMHLALGLTVALSALSAYAVATWRDKFSEPAYVTFPPKPNPGPPPEAP